MGAPVICLQSVPAPGASEQLALTQGFQSCRKAKGKGERSLPSGWGGNFWNPEVLMPSVLPPARWNKLCASAGLSALVTLVQGTSIVPAASNASCPSGRTGWWLLATQPAFIIRAAAEIKARAKPQKCRVWLSRGAEGKKHHARN